jgi:hypothetical protein
MTIHEAIARVDAVKPNRYKEAQKIAWLGNLEGQIFNELVLTHEHPPMIVQLDFNENMDTDQKLIAPHPYDEVYTLCLQSQIDLNNMEIAKYNNSKTLYNNAYQTLVDYWNRTHMPLGRVTHFKL